MNLLAQILTIYNWGVICVLLFFLFSIARFFEQRLTEKSSEQTRRPYYPFFLVPVFLFIISVIIYMFHNNPVVGNLIGDSLRIIGGIIVGIASYLVLRTMTGGRS